MFSKVPVSHSVQRGYLWCHVLSGGEYLWYPAISGGGYLWYQVPSRGGGYVQRMGMSKGGLWGGTLGGEYYQLQIQKIVSDSDLDTSDN